LRPSTGEIKFLAPALTVVAVITNRSIDRSRNVFALWQTRDDLPTKDEEQVDILRTKRHGDAYRKFRAAASRGPVSG
jgi:hypothetical protein